MSHNIINKISTINKQTC